MEAKKAISLTAVAKRIGVGYSRLRRLALKGEIKTIKLGEGSRPLVPQTEFERLAALMNGTTQEVAQ